MASINLSDIKQLSGDVLQQLEIRSSFDGYNEFKKALKDASPELRKAMDKEIRSLLKPVITDARARVPFQPLSGWRIGNGRVGESGGSRLPDWDQSTVRKGIVLRQGGKRSRGHSTQSAWKIQNKSAAGQVFELAKKQRAPAVKGYKNSGRVMTTALTLFHGETSRLIWAAWDAAGGEKKLTREVTMVVKTYEGKLAQQIRAAKGH